MRIFRLLMAMVIGIHTIGTILLLSKYVFRNDDDDIVDDIICPDEIVIDE